MAILEDENLTELWFVTDMDCADACKLKEDIQIYTLNSIAYSHIGAADAIICMAT